MEKPNLRLYKLFKNKDTVDNILEIYKALRGKENLEYRLLLKTLVYSTIYCPRQTAFLSRENYFDKFSFSKTYLLDVWSRYKSGRLTRAFGFDIKDIFGNTL